jgi:endonuclease/exonuclease/phosphatase family metal-dependent hydrolase
VHSRPYVVDVNAPWLRRVLLATLTLFFGLDIVRIYIPTVTWYLGRYLSPEWLGLYALFTFALALLSSIVSRLLGTRRALVLAVGGLASIRLLVQLARSAPANLVLATLGIALLGWFIPLWRRTLGRLHESTEVPSLAIAFPLALLLDSASRSLLMWYDLAWRYDWGAVAVVGLLTAIALLLLRFELPRCPALESDEPFPPQLVLTLVRLGLWFYLSLAITHNPSALMASTGWSDVSAHIVVNVMALLSLAAYVGVSRVAPRSPAPGGQIITQIPAAKADPPGAPGLMPQRGRLASGPPVRGRASMAASLLLSGALVLLFVGFGPGWLWVGLASLNSWAALGEPVLGPQPSESSPSPPQRRLGALEAAFLGLLRLSSWPRRHSSGITLITLIVTLVTAVTIAEYDLLWTLPLLGIILFAATTWVLRSQAVIGGSRLMHLTRIAAQPLKAPIRGVQGSLPQTGWSAGSVVGVTLAGTVVLLAFWGLITYHPSQADALAAAQPLRVMTYNIHHGIDADWRMDLKAIARVIELEAPDVIVLNEVNRARASNGFVDTLTVLSRQLRMIYIFGSNQRDGQYGNAVLSRYPIVEWENTRFNHNTTQVRGLLRAVIDTPAGRITLLATHLDHIEDHRNARTAQVAETLELWAGAPRTILMGDLNAEPYAPELQAIYDAGFVDVLEASGLDDVFTFWDPSPSRRIDFVFLTPDLPLARAWVVPSRASDHLPVLAEVGP